MSLQLSLLSQPQQDQALNQALSSFARAATIEERGAIFTRIEVVEFILDLAQYVPDCDLRNKRILEPSFGDGSFLLPCIRRLLKSWRYHSETKTSPEKELASAIFAVELHAETFVSTYRKVIDLLQSEGLTTKQATLLCDSWLIQGDFLLVNIPGAFDVVVGNPPYVRQELIPAVLLEEYRQRYHTIYDRADLYVPFIERSLSLLKPAGHLGFICSDRWMKNRYGGPLRKFVSKDFHLKYYVDMVGTPAFEGEVAAYPAITIFSKLKEGRTRIAHRPQIDRQELQNLAASLISESNQDSDIRFQEIEHFDSGDAPWLLTSSAKNALVKRLEEKFHLLESAGCKVGIGVATGADKIFIRPFDQLEVEQDRKLPMATTKDIISGQIVWRGEGVINPFTETGALVNLEDYPLLSRYLVSHRQALNKRHVASKGSNNWFRTIDRINPALAKKPKLLIPDIKGDAHIVYEEGQLYPHHNLYYILSDEWDLKALQAVLLSGVARFFVALYSTKMRGGYLRFQAQYLRRIRIPRWRDVPAGLQAELTAAVERQDKAACDQAVFKLYDLSSSEQEIFLESIN